LNDKKEDKKPDLISKIKKSPITKFVAITVTALVLVGAAGFVFKLMNFTASNYKQFKDTMRKD
jgi:hypothetical protein